MVRQRQYSDFCQAQYFYVIVYLSLVAGTANIIAHYLNGTRTEYVR